MFTENVLIVYNDKRKMSKQCYTRGNVLTVLSKCKLCLDSVQREGKVGFKGLVGLDKMDKKLGWKSKDV